MRRYRGHGKVEKEREEGDEGKREGRSSSSSCPGMDGWETVEGCSFGVLVVDSGIHSRRGEGGRERVSGGRYSTGRNRTSTER